MRWANSLSISHKVLKKSALAGSKETSVGSIALGDKKIPLPAETFVAVMGY